MAENTATLPSTLDFTAQIAVPMAQVKENANRLLTFEDENATLRRKNHNLSERLFAVETTPCLEL